GEREVHAAAHAAQDDAAQRGDDGGDAPRQREDALDTDAERLRHLLVVGGGAHGGADQRGLEEQRKRPEQGGHGDEAPQVYGRDRTRPQPEGPRGEERGERARVAAPGHVEHAAPDAGEAEGDHDDRDDRLADERAQDPPLDDQPEQDGDRQRQRERDR